MKTAEIRTNHHDVSCDVCGRTLLRGEQSTAFLAGGARRQVCELCTGRAVHEGWIRESGADEVATRRPTGEGRARSFFEKLRSRLERPRELPDDGLDDLAAAEERARRRIRRIEPVDGDGEPVDHIAAAEPEEPAVMSREPRHVRAVPTNAELKMQRALEVFNGSDHTRTVAGVARSLGAPAVGVRPLADRPSIVSISVVWDLSWYRYEVDLSDEAGGVQKAAMGSEPEDLPAEDRAVNAAADERGALMLAATPAAGG